MNDGPPVTSDGPPTEGGASGRQRRFLYWLVALVCVAILVVVAAQVIGGCWIDVGNEMGHQPSIGYVEPPRSSAPDTAVPFQGLDVMPGAPPPINPVLPSEASVSGGKDVYGIFCLVCHGGPGGQTGQVGMLFSPPPPHLDQVVAALSDGQIYLTATQGFGRMPALGSRMSELDRWNTVNYLRTTQPQPGVGPPSDPRERGAAVFTSQCAGCHGPTAGGALAPALYPSSLLAEMTPGEIVALVRAGRAGHGMPSFGGRLSDASLADVAALLKDLQANGPVFLEDYVRRQGQATPGATATLPGTTTTLSGTTTTLPRATSSTAPPAAVTTTSGVDQALVAKGEAVFSAACQPCHGADGAGGIGPKLKPNAFVGSSSDAQVRQVIENGRPGTAMPAWKGKLSPEDTDAAVALLRSWQQTTTTAGGVPTTVPSEGPATVPSGGSTTVPGGGSTTLPSGGSTTIPGGGAPPTTGPDGYATIPFTHRPHMEKGGMPCLFCHGQARRGPSADLPPLQLCAGCHRWLTVQTESTKAVVAAYDSGTQVSWRRVYKEPDFVFFTHQVHIQVANLECSTCHGDVAAMGLAHKVGQLNMKFCIDCHKKQTDMSFLMDCEICHK
jgi:mono/diheme cytochrome c family protein